MKTTVENIENITHEYDTYSVRFVKENGVIKDNVTFITKDGKSILMYDAETKMFKVETPFKNMSELGDLVELFKQAINNIE